MNIRGERECQNCGTRWTYYEQAQIECPDCGSLHSVSVGERAMNSGRSVELDVQSARNAVDTEPVETVADDAATSAREYIRSYGFINAGQLQPFDSTFVAATELWFVGRELARSITHSEDEKLYLFSLLEDVDSGTRPDPSSVPESLVPMRGLAAASAVRDYRRDAIRYLNDNPDTDVRKILGSITDHRKRIDALDGDVSPEYADTVIEAVREVGAYLIEGDRMNLDNARKALDNLNEQT